MTRAEIEEKTGISLQHGPGWDFLVEKLIHRVTSLQRWWVELYTARNGEICGKLEKETFAFTFLQAKEKYSQLRIYYEISPVEHDWKIFKKESYDKEYFSIVKSLEGYTDCLEQISGSICEECSARGSQTEINHWLKTLCGPCYSNLIHNEKQ